MFKNWKQLTRLFFTWIGVLAFAPLGDQTVEQACSMPAGRIDDAFVRVTWTDVANNYDDVRVSYCVLRGERDAKLAFERDAEIVYFALANVDRPAERRQYVFTIRTSQGRLVRQGPALLQPLARQPITCRVDVCQFFTEPGERVTSVAVESNQPRGR